MPRTFVNECVQFKICVQLIQEIDSKLNDNTVYTNLENIVLLFFFNNKVICVCQQNTKKTIHWQVLFIYLSHSLKEPIHEQVFNLFVKSSL